MVDIDSFSGGYKDPAHPLTETLGAFRYVGEVYGPCKVATGPGGVAEEA